MENDGSGSGASSTSEVNDFFFIFFAGEVYFVFLPSRAERKSFSAAEADENFLLSKYWMMRDVDLIACSLATVCS